MGLIDVAALPELQPNPPHAHENEEVWHVTGGALEMDLGGQRIRVAPGCAVVVPAGVVHSAVALEACRAIVVDHPARREVAGISI